MEKIKYAAVTTIENSIKSFMLPALEKMDAEKYDISLICNMSDDFKNANGEKFECIHVDMKRGFHLGSTLKCIWRLYRIFRKQKFDAVEYGTENAALCASIAAFFAGVPVRIYDHWGARFVGYSGFSRFLSKMIEKLAAMFSTHVRQVSRKNMEMCIEEHIYKRKKVKVLGLGGTVGVDFNKFNVENKEEYRREVREKYSVFEKSVVFGFLGRIQTDKGINELLNAFKRISESNSEAVLMLVGPIDEENQIDAANMEWAQKCERVIFTGRVSDPYRYISAFDIMTHPTYREGFGMVLQEAAALKIPIITTDIIGPGEFIKNNETGILVPAADCESLYSAMSALLSDEKRREELAENGYIYTKENFERSVMVGRIIEDRESIIEEKLKKKKK